MRTAPISPSPSIATAGTAPLPPLHVLVADDQIINVMIVSKLLTLLGCSVEQVENGRQAVERWQQGRFDLILMDVQMPVLDGLDATAQIRQLERSGHVPIVALTANALQEDRARCLAAGMDAYTVKPVTLDNLAQAMRDALRQADSRRAEASDTAAPQPTPTPDTAPALDLTRLRNSLGGDEELLQEFVQAMRVELHQRLERLRQAGLLNDGALAGSQAHALRGALGSIGAETAVALTRKLESEARTGQWPAFDQSLGQLQAQLQPLESALAAVLR